LAERLCQQDLVEHSDAQISWKTIEDLSLLRIGVMLDYANTPSFDRALLKGMLNIEASTDEITNLRKLAARRLDLAVMDELVFIRLRDASQQFAMLRANPHPLGSQPVIAAVRPTPRGLTLLEALTRSLGGDPPSPDLKLASQ
jgi:polar amino acid transport system substrate-binding protein